MATIPLKTLTLPDTGNKYTIPQIDNTLTKTGFAADSKKTGDEISALKTKVNKMETFLRTLGYTP